jgi:hypothetical protein
MFDAYTCCMCCLLQVRIHSADFCQFYLRVRSRPIIEHSSSLTFAPYAAQSLLCRQAAVAVDGSSPANGTQHEQQHHKQQEGAEQEHKEQQEVVCLPDWHPAEVLREARLLEDSGLWQQVDDFGWVKASASPHWRVLPEQDRQAVPDHLPQASGTLNSTSQL